MDKMTLYRNVVLEIAKMSQANRKKVGCLFVKNDSIVSYGFNHVDETFGEHCEELTDGGLVTRKELVHAELHAISKMIKNDISPKGCTVYVTCSPCMQCAKILYYHGITDIVYIEQYRDTSPIEWLTKLGVGVKHMAA